MVWIMEMGMVLDHMDQNLSHMDLNHMDIKNRVQPQQQQQQQQQQLLLQLQLLQPLQQQLLLPQQLLLLRLQLSPAFGNSGQHGIKEMTVKPKKYQGGDLANVVIVQKILEVNVEGVRERKERN